MRLSQQELVDCSWGEGNNACDGGEDFRAYQWIMKHGLASEDDYGPYLAVVSIGFLPGYCMCGVFCNGVGVKNNAVVQFVVADFMLDAVRIIAF